MANRVRSASGALLASAAVLAASASIMVTPAGAQPAAACVVKITRFAFDPESISRGGHTKLVLVARNCVDSALSVKVTEAGEQPPPGCPWIDPIAWNAVLQPMSRYKPNPLKMLIPQGCVGVETMAVGITDSNGTLLARATASLTITPS
jgi:hypothetical protein